MRFDHSMRLTAAAFAAVLVLAIPASATAQVVVTVLGDSNVVGKNVSPSEAYPAKLERALRARGLSVRVVSSGVNGETSDRTLGRVESGIAQGTKVAIVWTGINDIKRGASPASAAANNAAIAARLQARGIAVVVLRGSTFGDLFKNDKYIVSGDPERHLAPHGYDVVVARTIGQIQPLVAKAATGG